MKKVNHEIYSLIDNELYGSEENNWWEPNSPFFLMRSSINPVRIGYFKKKLFTELNVDPRGKSVLEVGCGGGILCEEIARMCFNVTGIDPSEKSLQVAENHAKTSGLSIDYKIGIGEALPYLDNSIDIVFCCDVLEHVYDLSKVISEISRVLKPGGYFFYDTLNRTFLSKIVAINISQVWKRWAYAPPNLHVWKMFIKPNELRYFLRSNNLKWKEHRGLQLNASFFKLLPCLRKRSMGALTYKELGERFCMVEGNNMNIMYMGYAAKL